ncbi:Fis family sigma-54 specific transcriptional regulator [Thermincola ferriacetica]|uniref:Fis family sigma-54 specific transcriptional regulator n=1 Tax=Thermincola ferriacetica TaxID=281456 RepID=A0A0L6W098_9FIRM|nr:sigma-54-dependent Fis family transcriptional regulator [Thermincola ferriacetica]KNZ68997.1 Fis family sigma-54 specific transcriptional regulator [Thermincola ferriacetica]
MAVVQTIKERCQTCYSCIRNCPAKAIKVVEGQATVVEERCVSCGNCVRVCAQKAKVVDSRDMDLVKGFLSSDQTVVIMLAPSFPAAFAGVAADHLFEALLAMGFAHVEEVTTGVQLTVPKYQELLEKGDQECVIASYCPAVVGLIEKHYPQLISYLAPIDSAVTATGKYVKKKFPNAKVVLAGPCIAKKEEARSDKRHIIDAVLTFKELKELFSQAGIEVPKSKTEKNVGENFLPRLFPLPGGLIKNLKLVDGFIPELASVEGIDNCLNILQNMSQGKVKPRFIDILFCQGCIDGPEIDSDKDLLTRKALVFDYAQKKLNNPARKLPFLDLTRTYSDQSRQLPYPSENEIRKILKHTYKIKPEDELNCGACGYNTCREKAIAVYQGLAEIDMCLPYLLHKSRGEIEYYRDRLKKAVTPPSHYLDAIIGESEVIKNLKRTVEKAAKSDSTILIQGESGVGKEMIALAVHNLSSRRNKPFIGINCAALPELLLESELFGYEEGAFTGARKGGKLGKFELAEGGTILLDEIGDLPLSMQAKLLRVLQEREFERVGGTSTIKLNVRVMAATNRDLRKLAQEGKFRIDLFYRLNVLPISVPPLRARTEDIPLLIGHFIEKLTKDKNISPKIVADETLELLLKYDWPGNVRELENIIERAIYLTEGNVIREDCLPPHVRELKGYSGQTIKPIKEAVREIEKQLITEALKATKGNKVMAAKLLGITRVTLYQKLKEFNLE